MLTQEEWSGAELWFQYRAAQPGTEAEGTDSGEAGGEGSKEAGEGGPERDSDTISRSGSLKDEQYDRYGSVGGARLMWVSLEVTTGIRATVVRPTQKARLCNCSRVASHSPMPPVAKP